MALTRIFRFKHKSSPELAKTSTENKNSALLSFSQRLGKLCDLKFMHFFHKLLRCCSVWFAIHCRIAAENKGRSHSGYILVKSYYFFKTKSIDKKNTEKKDMLLTSFLRGRTLYGKNAFMWQKLTNFYPMSFGYVISYSIGWLSCWQKSSIFTWAYFPSFNPISWDCAELFPDSLVEPEIF